jgi:hypothetical protein
VLAPFTLVLLTVPRLAVLAALPPALMLAALPPALLAPLDFWRLAALPDGLPRCDRPGAALAALRRLAARVLLCTGMELPLITIDHGELFHDY